MIIKSPAKLNLSLDVIGKRINGYHDVRMIMQTVSLYDEIEISRSDNIEVSTNLNYIPNDNRNLAYKAAVAFFDSASIKSGVRISIHKKIPVGAGLGGGSSNAASVLMGLNKLYDGKLTTTQLATIGKEIGADVPFFFTGGTCLAEGLGEELTSLSNTLKCWVVIVKPTFSVSTKWVYENLNLDEIMEPPGTDRIIKSIENNDIKQMAQSMVNMLESVTVNRYPEIEVIKSQMMEEEALGAMMSGSGSAVFAVFDNEKAAQNCAAYMQKKYQNIFIAEFI